jgi:hypothetical protein
MKYSANPKIKENIEKIKNILNRKDVHIYFVPSSSLKELVSKGEHPFVKGIPNNRKAEILSGGGVLIQKRMLYRWLNDELDDKNSWILSNGDIRVIDPNIVLTSDGTKKE